MRFPNVDVQDIGTLVHESHKLESVEIREKNSIGVEDDNNKDEEEVEWESKDEEERKRKSFNRSSILKQEEGSPRDVYWSSYDVYTSASTSVPLGTSASPATTSIPSTSSSIPPRNVYTSGDLDSIYTVFKLEFGPFLLLFLYHLLRGRHRGPLLHHQHVYRRHLYRSWYQGPRFKSWQQQYGNFNLSNVGGGSLCAPVPGLQSAGPLSHHDLHSPPGRRAVWV
ncbi:hypothetical protein M9H77_27096 [Catharanthus roseus]|uniref:Uncharacterized protein n=1 Tax=Catharanthus roseus TaxID=4058 RepID=A0ACC0ABJ3_CATRO|nr:hypothetical protein M9H77_27096 [Catharanthus roseus]